MHVCLLGPGTRRRYAICVYAPRVPLPGYLCVLTNATPRLATWHDMVTYLRSWWRCVACLLFVCMRRHTFCPLSLFFASYISGRAGGRWARFCVVLYLGGLFVPPRLSLHTMLLVRGGDGLAAVWAEASTPQTTSFPGRLIEVRSTGGRHPTASASANR